MRAAIYAHILFALLCLLTLATLASAECAWVLWAEESWIGANVPTSWTLVEAFRDSEACRRGQTGKLSSYAKEKPAEGIERKITANIISDRFTATGAYRDVRFLCAPDTVDPRGPKAK